MCINCGSKYSIRLLTGDGEIMARRCGHEELSTIQDYFDDAKEWIDLHGMFRSNVKTIQVWDWASETIVASLKID